MFFAVVLILDFFLRRSSWCGQNAGRGGEGGGPRCRKKRGGATGGAEAAGGGEEGQICQDGGREGEYETRHQGQGTMTLTGFRWVSPSLAGSSATSALKASSWLHDSITILGTCLWKIGLHSIFVYFYVIFNLRARKQNDSHRHKRDLVKNWLLCEADWPGVSIVCQHKTSSTVWFQVQSVPVPVQTVFALLIIPVSVMMPTEQPRCDRQTVGGAGLRGILWISRIKGWTPRLCLVLPKENTQREE